MDVIDIKVRDRRVIGQFQDEPFEVSPKSYCLVDCDGDLELAKVKSNPYTWAGDAPLEHEVYLIRPSEESDFSIIDENAIIERDAFKFALEKIRERDLPMSLGAVERSFDGKKLRFYFTADNRIDFRELVKDLAAVYKTRIEMRQIGVRDRSKKIGGFGICGEELCCSRFLQKFEPITIRMAKEQNLALNPTKISGLCGRLMCCLSYEVDQYVEARSAFPPNGTHVETPQGEGYITNFNYVHNTVSVRVEDNKIIECSKEDLVILSDRKPVHSTEFEQIDEELHGLSD